MVQLDALKKAHAEEMADVVREHNKKYSAMLAQQLNEQDTLKDQLEKVHKVCGSLFCVVSVVWFDCE